MKAFTIISKLIEVSLLVVLVWEAYIIITKIVI